jgi:hypothetical protein
VGRYQITLIGAIVGVLGIGLALVLLSAGNPLAAGFLVSITFIANQLVGLLQAEVNGHRLTAVEKVAGKAAVNATAASADASAAAEGVAAAGRRADRTDVATGVDTAQRT